MTIVNSFHSPNNLQGHVCIGDLLQTTLPNNCFDIIFVKDTVGYLSNQPGILKNFQVPFCGIVEMLYLQLASHRRNNLVHRRTVPGTVLLQ